MRKNKAFSTLALSLSADLRSAFRVDELRDSMKAASALYNQIVQHFEAGDGINSDYLLQDLVTRKLRPGESVSAYVDDVGRKVTQRRVRGVAAREPLALELRAGFPRSGA